MKTLKLLQHLRGAWCVLTSASLILGGIGTASAFTASDRATAYSAWKNTFYYVDHNGQMAFKNRELTGGSTSFWQGAEMIELVEDAVDNGLDTTNTVNALIATYRRYNSDNWSWNTFNDDIMWASCAFNRAYQLTGNTTYLTIAQNNWDIAFNRGWDFAGGGGLFQDTGSGASKCTCGNAPGADAAYMLYRNLQGVSSTNSYYLGRAQLMYNWMKANVFNTSNNGVEEGPGNPGVYFTYDDGTFASIAFWLGDTTTANAVVDFVQSRWGNSWQSFGTGSDAGIFNTIGLRGLARVGHNVAYLQASADQGWGYRNNLNLGSVNFGGQTPNGTDLYCADASDLPAALVCTPLPGSREGTYVIVNRNSGLAADVSQALVADGTPVHQYAINGGANQNWTVNSLGNGNYKIIGVPSGRALETVGGGTANGTLIDIWRYTGGANQQWSITANGSYYRLVPQNATDKCLDVQHSGLTNGTPLEIWTSGSANSQQWSFQAP